MTENLLQKLEEKTIVLLTELEALRREVVQLRKTNALLISDKETYTTKLQDLISILDTIPLAEENSVKQLFIQGRDEYATA